MDDLDFGQTLRGFAAGQKVFERYTLMRMLGRGGMGVVWLAQDEKLRREVALKFLPEVVAQDREAIEDLKRETRRALELTHPRIVRIYDFVDDSRLAAVSMEYVPGSSLAVLKLDQPQKCFSVAQLAPWVQQLCEALAYAHTEAQIVHRDLKPANLMVDAKGALKIADFGISATLSDTATRASKQASSSGTPVYMSPQQMMGEKPAATDDIYSLGATLYELLTGKPPFYSGNVLLQVQNKVPPSLTARRAELGVESAEAIPAAWEETIAACLAKQSEDRPQSAADVWRRLNGVGPDLASAPGSAVGPDLGRGRAAASKLAPHKLEGTAKSKLPLALGLAAVLAVAGWAGWYYGIEQPAQRRLAEQQRQEEARRVEVARQEVQRQAESARLESARAEAEQARKAAEERAATAKRSITIPDLKLELLPMPAGSFMMGSESESAPVTQVRLTQPFWIGKYEVTQAQWEMVMGNNPSIWRGDNRPVDYVSWNDAMQFCQKLTARERAAGRLPSGYEYTLPTEAQWEYACRAGMSVSTTGYIADVAWFSENSDRMSHPVGQKKANAWGLYDMYGNVAEWCSDWYAKQYLGGTICDPVGPGSGSTRVYRGGNCYSSDTILTPYHRGCCKPSDPATCLGYAGPGDRGYPLGFRLALCAVR